MRILHFSPGHLRNYPTVSFSSMKLNRHARLVLLDGDGLAWNDDFQARFEHMAHIWYLGRPYLVDDLQLIPC